MKIPSAAEVTAILGAITAVLGVGIQFEAVRNTLPFTALVICFTVISITSIILIWRLAIAQEDSVPVSPPPDFSYHYRWPIIASLVAVIRPC